MRILLIVCHPLILIVWSVAQEEETDRASIDTPVVSPKDGANMNEPEEQVCYRLSNIVIIHFPYVSMGTNSHSSCLPKKAAFADRKKSRKWESFLQCMFFLCASYDIWLTVCLFLLCNLLL